jgi:hypothetical protein
VGYKLSNQLTSFERKMIWLEIHIINNKNSEPVFSKKYIYMPYNTYEYWAGRKQTLEKYKFKII